MKPGPKPTPRNLRIVSGSKDQTPKADRPKAPIDEPPVRAPKPPDYLTPEEAECFRANAIKLAGMRVMTEADVDALVIYVRNWLDAQEARKKLQEDGLIIDAPRTGTAMLNPYLTIARKAEERCLRVMAEFGLTPSSRNRVSQ